jgi:hydroxymethylpyrimidine/phosphomethylpyrimidine kinase
MLPVALTIAGSDPGGGAGIQADLKTFHSFGVYGTAAITLITVQNTDRLSRSVVLDAALVREQIEAVLEDLAPGAVKTGALGTAAVVEAIARISFRCPLVVDPVMVSSSGAPLLVPAAVQALRDLLLPRAALITPNLSEAVELAGMAFGNLNDMRENDMREAARRIAGLGPGAVLIKGGHLESGDAVDVLLSGGVFREFRGPRISTRHTHGTGCTYSAAITALLARGLRLEDAVAGAKSFVTEAIRTAPGIGAGSGPLNHWAPHRWERPRGWEKPPDSL